MSTGQNWDVMSWEMVEIPIEYGVAAIPCSTDRARGFQFFCPVVSGDRPSNIWAIPSFTRSSLSSNGRILRRDRVGIFLRRDWEDRGI